MNGGFGRNLDELITKGPEIRLGVQFVWKMKFYFVGGKFSWTVAGSILGEVWLVHNTIAWKDSILFRNVSNNGVKIQGFPVSASRVSVSCMKFDPCFNNDLI
jgi:hypothetical protein